MSAKNPTPAQGKLGILTPGMGLGKYHGWHQDNAAKEPSIQ